tara:strand:+ start:41 stop:478 length:438 start_codon:yes stop_codon:yes gene_type:complete
MANTAKTKVDEQLDAQPATELTLPIEQVLTDGQLLTLSKFDDFSDIGQPIRIFKDGKPVFDADGAPVYDKRFNFKVYYDNEVVGQFKHVTPEIDWAVIRVKCNHFVTDKGETRLFFTLMNKLNTVADAASYIANRPQLLEMKEQI